MKETFILITPFLTAFIGGFFTLIATKDNNDLKRYIAIVSSILIIALLVVTYFTWKPIDPYQEWIAKVKSDYRSAQDSKYERLKKAMKLNPLPQHVSKQSDKYYRDIRVGKLLASEPEFSDILNRKFGIKTDSFIGSGVSVPWDKDYKKSSSREYLVRNIDEKDDDVWTWILAPAFTNYGKKVSELLLEIPPTQDSNTQPLSKYLSTVKKRMRNIHGIAPVIRFQKFPEHYYKGTVGRKESDYVFFSNLHDVYDLSIEEAAEASGYRLANAGSDSSNTKLFIWLYVPTHAQSSRKATWGNVIEILQQ